MNLALRCKDILVFIKRNIRHFTSIYLSIYLPIHTSIYLILLCNLSSSIILFYKCKESRDIVFAIRELNYVIDLANLKFSLTKIIHIKVD